MASLRDARAALGDRAACLARNLTKPHERYQRATLSTLIADLEGEATVRGESTVVIEGAARAGARANQSTADPSKAAALLLREGAPPRAVVALLTASFGCSRRAAYRLAHRQGEGE